MIPFEGKVTVYSALLFPLSTSPAHGLNKEPKAARNEIDIEKETWVKKVRTAINNEDTTTFCNELNKILECIYFDDTCDENDDIETSINFVIKEFNGQTTIPTDSCHNMVFTT